MILEENPEHPYESFEEFSLKLKRRYIHKEVYLQSVFVDSINRTDCNRNLQLYKVIKKYPILILCVPCAGIFLLLNLNGTPRSEKCRISN